MSVLPDLSQITASWRSFSFLWVAMLAASLLVLLAWVLALRTSCGSVRSGLRTSSRGAWGLAIALSLGLAVAPLFLANLVFAIERARQKRTMGELRSVGTAVEAYAVDHNAYPVLPSPQGSPVELTVALPSFTQGTVTSLPRMSLREAAALAPAIQPVYIGSLPTRDGWGHPLFYASTGQDYLVVSGGRNGALEPWAWTHGPGSSWDDDFIFMDGQFHQY